VISKAEFAALAAQGFNRIPLMRVLQADLDTPLTLYLKLANQPNSFLLESVVGGERFGRYSFIGLPAKTRIEARDQSITVSVNGQVVETHQADPIEFAEKFLSRFKVAITKGMPRFCGGLAGYFGYDTVRHIEPRLSTPLAKNKTDPIGVPDIVLLLTEQLAIIDNLAGHLYLVVYADLANTSVDQAYEQALNELNRLEAKLHMPVAAPKADVLTPTEVIRDFKKADYLAAVGKAKEYIAAGDVMQVQIGQVLRKPYAGSPLTLYRALRSINPSPYMYFYDLGDFHVVGASPEILVRQDLVKVNEQTQTRVTIRPIAGTRPRGATPEQDLALEAELLADPKERAEHVMLIDLARNDLGRIAQIGSVHVTEQMVVERYSHVMHLVSNVEGLLQPGLTALDVLRASFPAGTLTGAPKIRAMEIIDELEPTKRGLYGGACGYLSFAGDMDLAIAIRTGVLKDGMLHAQAAAGIVADSILENEWLETENKARAMIRAAELAENGLIQGDAQGDRHSAPSVPSAQSTPTGVDS
jgi:anthranilate synthase component I